jgi:hypothetical protein
MLIIILEISPALSYLQVADKNNWGKSRAVQPFFLFLSLSLLHNDFIIRTIIKQPMIKKKILEKSSRSKEINGKEGTSTNVSRI